MSLRSMVHDHQYFQVSFPHEYVIQMTLNRPAQLNCIDVHTSKEMQNIWAQFDLDETFRVGIITGVGRAFCAGGDLKGIVNDMSAPGLGGLTRRSGRKPIIAAVNGICMGGGLEMIANCDIIVASSAAMFALPEVKRGIIPVAGCLPRLTRTIGLQRTTYLALTGNTVSANQLYDWGLITQVVQASMAEDVIRAALQIADDMCSNSPDALIVAREGIRLSWETGNVEEAVSAVTEQWYPRLMKGRNFHEGIRAFAEKRQPRWTASKL